MTPWSHLLAMNTPGPLPPSVPVFLAQGGDDQLVSALSTATYAEKLCRHGSSVVFELGLGVGHDLIAYDSAEAMTEWVKDRFAEQTPPDQCQLQNASKPSSADLSRQQTTSHDLRQAND